MLFIYSTLKVLLYYNLFTFYIQFLKVSEFIRYTGDIEHIDMGLIKLKEPLQFSSTIMPACLPTKRNEVYPYL